MMRTVIAVGLCLVLAPAALAAVHLTVLSLASLLYRVPAALDPARLRYLILVPARNEESVIGATLTSLADVTRPDDIVYVIADRCTDATAAIARHHGAAVLERMDGAVPGKAAALVDGIATAATWEWDAVTIIDADTVVEPGLLEALDVAFANGASAAQPRSEHVREPGVLRRISEVAFAFQGVSLPRGRSVLGIGARLRGSGMTVLRDIAERYPYVHEGVSEDTFLNVRLVLDDVPARHVDDARIRSLAAPSMRAGSDQRVRWEVGRMSAARRFAGPLLRHRTRTSIELAALFLSPPFAVAAFLAVAVGVVAWLLGFAWLGWLSVAVGVSLAIDVVIALVESRAPARTWLALAAAPVYLPWKAALQIAAIGRLRTSEEAWEPTARD